MTKKTIIPAGYRITVVSWENDADNYNTEVKEGFTEDEAKFLVELFKKFSSCNNHNKGIGNLRGSDEDMETYKSVIAEVVSRHPVASTSEKFSGCFKGPDDDGDVYYGEYLYDFGLGGTEYSLTRVCESVKVEYVPQEIILVDVTDQFK